MDLYKNIPYKKDGENEVPSLDFYPAKEKKSDAFMLIFAGGGYASRCDYESIDYATGFFNKLGINCAVCNYRVAPNEYPAPLLDARKAVKIIKSKADELKIDPKKIVVVGSSAGGHLAGMTAMFSDTEFVDDAEKQDELSNYSASVAGAVLCYPVISMNEFTHEGSAQLLCGNRRDELKDKLSIHKTTNKNLPPLFIWHTFEDETVDVRNSLMMATRCKELGTECELHIFPTGWHGMGLAEIDEHPQVKQWRELCKNWLIAKNFLSK